eukprot:Ihof_evm3s181 gene=Ihof_evmTU3s181
MVVSRRQTTTPNITRVKRKTAIPSTKKKRSVGGEKKKARKQLISDSSAER